MQEIRLHRNGREDLVFIGEHLATVDDREWMGIAPNWWELALYRSEAGRLVLSSVFYLNFPRHRVLRGAVVFQDIADVRDYVVNACNGPSMIADGLLGRARRRIRQLDDPVPPLPRFASVADYESFGEREIPYA
ncbi:hypothetical protein RVX_R24590 [Nitratidesulfovibrio sp. HK-II]|uniref:hypothetical protein n=1 Tax=Nitratidesulfovibrio sp. HK-II TaxID=2009266 RepID=UPI000E2FB756|nr:hypothetical protein [Nitratidesulfovibrio sp. HK-II]GBO96835.1 hypothetical protein RVX_1874 [Nitratidesulfovibrio sp. HK-II]